MGKTRRLSLAFTGGHIREHTGRRGDRSARGRLPGLCPPRGCGAPTPRRAGAVRVRLVPCRERRRVGGAERRSHGVARMDRGLHPTFRVVGVRPHESAARPTTGTSLWPWGATTPTWLRYRACIGAKANERWRCCRTPPCAGAGSAVDRPQAACMRLDPHPGRRQPGLELRESPADGCVQADQRRLQTPVRAARRGSAVGVAKCSSVFATASATTSSWAANTLSPWAGGPFGAG